ncbi:NAD(P)-dependent dehydrogenase (short-subunit alcohol dehydrogenase family) [Actinocorallia herbida]|uniref:NAD(P)-dependent dehydrogenase (Short-subunit alcohol dehydrogenase family) n=1 Tax=Actinocorallia herbida TaxID=58109 RepID=A0A3N1D382_9ACTN|nr:glucose 1-dehydrogenase [Actinocorallia herbida]ROO87982.1 NAD(P)-dependent dehydrogenase (short-subunit alcohol dehydrogenase family) [Actinocorallia herbida]
MKLMEGRAGLVTGAAAGIGRAIALLFAAEGAKVVVSDINEAGGTETVDLITAAGGTASFLRADASVEEDARTLVAAVVDRYGALDWAVNNAGLTAPVAPVTEQQGEWWTKVLSVDLVGVMFGLKHQITQMQAQGRGGAIVNIASTAGMTGQFGMSPYVSAKWGVIGLTKTAALENARTGIRVNAVAPGITRTPGIDAWASEVPDQAAAVLDHIPVGRAAEPDEQAQAALWLASDKASYITGIALPVDGGHTIGG